MLRFADIGLSFGDRRVLDGLSFHVEKGEVYGLLGPNGAGKTTAINILCGLLTAGRGKVLINGSEVSAETRRRVGIAPQELSIYQDLTCRQNLRFFGQVFGVPSRSVEKRIREMSDDFGLEEYLNTPVVQLSGGWKRRVNMAVALMHAPDLVVLDEPTVGVDVEARYELWNLIKRLHRRDVTVLLTTHHLEEAEALCQRIGILSDGSLADELRKLVPGELSLVIETDAREAAMERGTQLGWMPRQYKGPLSFLLPARITIPEVVAAFGDIPLTSLSLEEIALEHVYFEVTQNRLPTS